MKVRHKNQHSLLPIFEYRYNIQTTKLKGCAILQIRYKWENFHLVYSIFGRNVTSWIWFLFEFEFECLGACLLAEDDKTYISLPGGACLCATPECVFNKSQGAFCPRSELHWGGSMTSGPIGGWHSPAELCDWSSRGGKYKVAFVTRAAVSN